MSAGPPHGRSVHALGRRVRHAHRRVQARVLQRLGDADIDQARRAVFHQHIAQVQGAVMNPLARRAIERLRQTAQRDERGVDRRPARLADDRVERIADDVFLREIGVLAFDTGGEGGGNRRMPRAAARPRLRARRRNRRSARAADRGGTSSTRRAAPRSDRAREIRVQGCRPQPDAGFERDRTQRERVRDWIRQRSAVVLLKPGPGGSEDRNTRSLQWSRAP